MATSNITALWCKVPLAPRENMSFNLNDCSLVSAQQHARPCRDKRDRRQMVTDDLDESFTDEHSKPRHVWLVCVHTAASRRQRFTGAVSTRPALDFHQSKSVVALSGSSGETFQPQSQTHKDKSQTSKSSVAWDAHWLIGPKSLRSTPVQHRLTVWQPTLLMLFRRLRQNTFFHRHRHNTKLQLQLRIGTPVRRVVYQRERMGNGG